MSLTPCEHIPYPILISAFFVQACLTALGLLLTRRLWVQIFVMIIFFIIVPICFYLLIISFAPSLCTSPFIEVLCSGAFLGYSTAGMVELRMQSVRRSDKEV
jgi:MFS-type transporter involved in bile tolerance (Atg22 family)